MRSVSKDTPPTTVANDTLSPTVRAAIRDLLKFFEENKSEAERAAKTINALYETSAELRSLAHSVRWRVKSVPSLKLKLEEKAKKDVADGVPFHINRGNFFDEITDVAGFRILHLHTSQFEKIDQAIKQLMLDRGYSFYEKPFARVWDLEYRHYFEKLGLEIEESDSYYTSVHYLVDFNSKSKCKCEIQVRTLAEELWGEVDHSINYPIKAGFVPCEEQIKALARATSTCTRLVDSIFMSYSCKPKKRSGPKAAH